MAENGRHMHIYWVYNNMVMGLIILLTAVPLCMPREQEIYLCSTMYFQEWYSVLVVES
jgi:hypothetical protein